MTQDFQLSRWGVQEMSPAEALDTDGGILPLLLIGAAILLAGCGNTVIYNGNGGRNTNNATSSSSVDSTGNGSGNGNRFP